MNSDFAHKDMVGSS